MTTPTESEMVLAVADIDGFDRACRDKSDVETFAMLDRFYRLVGTVVEDAGGTVVKFMGDCALMVFPKTQAGQAKAALDKLRTAAKDIWTEFGCLCRVRVHAHVGRVASGPLGPGQRFDMVGAAVNELFRMPWDGPELSEALRKIMEE